MSNEYEQRVNPLTAFLHEQALAAQAEEDLKRSDSESDESPSEDEA